MFTTTNMPTNTKPAYSPAETDFILGPIPAKWSYTAMRCHRNGAKVALLLWHQVGLNRSWTVSIPTAHLHAAGMDARALSATLRAMEKAGLVDIELPRGSKHRISLVQVGGEKRRRNYPEPNVRAPRPGRYSDWWERTEGGLHPADRGDL